MTTKDAPKQEERNEDDDDKTQVIELDKNATPMVALFWKLNDA